MAKARAPRGAKREGENLDRNGVEALGSVSAANLGEFSPRAVAMSQQRGQGTETPAL